MYNTSEKLMQISMKTFSEKGYYGTSLNNIANDLGVKKASLYNYIKSKDDLYGMCLEKSMEAGLRLMEDIDTQSENLLEGLMLFLQQYLDDSNHLVKFYTQLAFAPSNFTKDIETYNNKIATVFTKKLKEIHSYNDFNVDQDDFILLVNMFVFGWIYKQSFIQTDENHQNLIQEFERHAKLLLCNLSN